ncbi:proteasome component M29 [Cryomyces antarcticus]|nr:proteasome component M29 [Cryomyces antarcticus]
MSDVIIEILSPVMEGLVSVDESAMDVDGGTEALKNDKVREQTLAAAIETLQDAINPKLLRASELSAKVLRVLDLIAKSETLQARSSVVELASFQALGKLFQKLKNSEGEAVRAMQAEMWAKCSSLLFGPTGSSEAIRLKRADAILALAELSQLFPTQSKLSTEIATEKSPAVRKVLEQALEVRLQKG